MSVFLPTNIGNYRVIAQLGQGGMARALLALRQGPGGFRKLFVLKELRANLSLEAEFIEMFLNEARLAAMLSHPNVVQTHEVGCDDSNCFISMDYLEGQSYGRVLRRLGRTEVPLPLSVYVLSEVLSGLHYAHELSDFDGSPLSVVHRDVSPGNIFLSYDGQVKVLDFGIAKAAGAQFETKVGVLKGKLGYMAPEQAMANDVDRRSDIFSVGILLWEAIAGRRMVTRGEAEPVTLHNRVTGVWPPIAMLKPDAPAELISACDRAMALDPDDRFATAAEFRRALLDYLAGYLSSERASETSDVGRAQVAALVSENFAPERQQITNKIAQMIESDGPPRVDEELIPRLVSTTDLPAPVPADMLPRNMSAIQVLSSSDSSSSSSSSSSGSTLDHLQAEAHARRGPQLARKHMVMISLVVVAMCAGAVLAYVMRPGAGDASTPPLAATKAATKTTEAGAIAASTDEVAPGPETTDTEPTPATAAMMTLEVSVKPTTAVVVLDGSALGEGAQSEEVEADGLLHRLVIRADGFVTEHRSVRFERDTTIEIELTPSTELGTSTTVADGSNLAAKKPRTGRNGSGSKNSTRNGSKNATRNGNKNKPEDTDSTGTGKQPSGQSTDNRPREGDVLKAPDRKDNREIDEENPYK